jgi:hypothetical protein
MKTFATNGLSTGGVAIILALAAGAPPQYAVAADEGDSSPPLLMDREFTVALGGFFPRIESTVTLTSPRGFGKEVSGEDLGLDKSLSSAWIHFNWRFRPRHQFQAEWFLLDRDGARTVDRPLELGDTVIGAGASLESEMKLNVGRLTYGYSFFRDEKLDIAVLVGAHFATAKLTATAAGNVSVNGTPVVGGSRTESTSTKTFPLPHIGGTATYAFTPKFTGELSLLVFALDLGDYSGSLLETDAFLAYQLTKHFGIGGGLKYFNLDLKANTSRGGSVAYRFKFFGPAVFGYVSF